MSVSAEVPARMGRLTVLEHDPEPTRRTHVAPVRLGPLLTVCGVVGGAGATTLAYLIALGAAQQYREPILVADTGGPSGGLAACAGIEAPRSLPELASQLAAGLGLRGELYATGPAGVRVLATRPDFSPVSADEQLGRLLGDAREAHRLTVIDCGTLAREVDQVVMAAASHIAWVMPASAHGVDRGGRVLEAAPRLTVKELIVGRREIRQSKAPVRELRRIAATRRAPLVLVPHLTGLGAGRLDRAAEEAQVPVHAILGAIGR